MQVKFISIFAGIGFFISFISGIFAGNKFGYISLIALISAVIFGGLGFAIHLVLEKKVPEVIEVFSGESIGGGGNEGEEQNGEGTRSNQDSEYDGVDASGMSSSDSIPDAAIPNARNNGKDGNFGDHLVIANVTIKNEPKLMAEAIRTIMSQDSDVEKS